MKDSHDSVCLLAGGFCLLFSFKIHCLSENHMKMNAIIAFLQHQLVATYTKEYVVDVRKIS